MALAQPVFFRDIATNASLAMALEVSATPKPGNVHRLRDFEKTSYEQFLASAISVFPVFEEAAGKAWTAGPGEMIGKAVERSVLHQKGGNTHFGTFVLLIPLVMAAAVAEDETAPDSGAPDTRLQDRIASEAKKICGRTTEKDARAFYSAFALSGAAVQPDPDGAFDLSDPSSVGRIADSGKSLSALMAQAAGRDLIAAEWTNGFEKSRLFAEKIGRHYDELGRLAENAAVPGKTRINTAIVVTFAEFLAAVPDTFIATKQNRQAAEEVCEKARLVLEKCGFGPDGIHLSYDTRSLAGLYEHLSALDDAMSQKGQNPGSLADICAAGLFLFLAGGRRI